MNQNARLSPKAVSVALSGTLVAVFILCAIVQALVPSLALSHMWVSLFTTAPIGSASAWIEGILSNIVFGVIMGHIFAWIYNWVIGRKA